MRTYSALALAAMLLAACAPDALAPRAPAEITQSQATLSPTGATLPFEKRYVRATGTPVTDIVTIEALNASTTEEITVRVINNSGGQRATGGLVQVAGVTVLDDAAFPFSERVMQVNIGAVRPVRVLSRITGTKNGSYTVRIESGAPIDERGGNIAVAGGDIRIAVPAGAVPGDVSISAEPITIPAGEPTYDAYEFGPDGTTFDKPITVTFPVPSTPLPVGGVPGLFWRQNEADEWQPLANGRFDAQAGTVSGEIAHFTQIGVRVREMRVCPDGINAATSVADALAKVSRRGTIVLCDAQHIVNDVVVDKPVTITSADATPARVVSTGTHAFLVNGIAKDSVIVRRLNFTVSGTGGAGVFAAGTYDALRVDSSTFTLAPLAGSAVYAGATTVNGATFTMLDNVVAGGLRGAHVVGAPFVRIRNNQFTAQDSANVDVIFDNVTRTNGEVVQNRVRTCGSLGCLRLLTVGAIRADSNTISSDGRTFITPTGATRVISAAILAFGTDVRITGNSLIGTNVSNPAVQESYVWGDAGIYVVTLQSAPSRATINGNYVEGGRRAFANAWGPSHTVEPIVTGSDNVAARNFRVMQTVGAARLQLTRGNYTEYVIPFVASTPIVGRTGWSAGDITCNYWGVASGPELTTATGPITLPVFLPAAPQPIANSSIGCNPSPIALPALTRYCSTSASLYDAFSSFSNMQIAVRNTAPNGALEVCSGTHAPGRTTIAAPITIRGEAGATRPTLNGTLNNVSTQVFFISDAIGGTTRIQNLRFTNSRFESVRVAGANGPVVIENNAFEPLTDPAPANGGVGFFAGVAVFSTGDAVRVQNNSFSGGDIGVNTFTQFNVVVDNNSFAGHGNAAVHLGGGAETFAVVSNNTVNGCGALRCFLANNTKTVAFVDNVLNVPFQSARTTHGIDMAGDSLLAIGNRITGAGGTQTADNTTWPVLIGIKIYGGRRAVVNGNAISQVFSAMRFDAAQVTGRDNLVDRVWTGFDARNGSTTMTRSDFTNYVQPVFVFAAPAGSPFACNYWGGSTGPVNPGPLQPVNYTPFATVPIAGSALACP